MDISGFDSIAWTSLYYGALGAFVAHVALTAICHSKASFIWIIIAVSLAALNISRDSQWHRTPVDRFISFVGYRISLLSPYTPQDNPLPANCTPVIAPDTRLDAITPTGKLSIETGHGLLRTIIWDGSARQIGLSSARTRAGMVYSFYRDEWPGYDWKEHKGITRCRYYEQQKDFKAPDDFVDWMKQTQNTTLPYVYSGDGLMVGWHRLTK